MNDCLLDMDDHHQHATIYSTTPSIVQSLTTISQSTTDRNDFISSLVHSLVQSDNVKQSLLIDSLKYQQQIIGTNSKNLHQFSKQKKKRLSRKANKILSKTIDKVRHDAQQVRINTDRTIYNDYIFMNDLWKQYMTQLLKDTTSNDVILQRVATADYHGALIRVVNAKNPSLVDKQGIVIQETKNMIVIVERTKTRPCSLLKRDCLFSVQVTVGEKERTVIISGVAIAARPEQRGQKRSMSIEYMREFC